MVKRVVMGFLKKNLGGVVRNLRGGGAVVVKEIESVEESVQVVENVGEAVVDNSAGVIGWWGLDGAFGETER